MSHQEYKPLWRIIAREGDFCSIQGQSSGSVWHSVNINDLEKANGKEGQLRPCSEPDDCDGNEEERQLELFPT